MTETNPWTGTPYNSIADVEKDLKDNPRCRRKILAIWERIKEGLSKEHVRALCGIWGCANEQEFMKKMASLNDDELRGYVDRVKRRKRKALLKSTAVLVHSEAGMA